MLTGNVSWDIPAEKTPYFFFQLIKSHRIRSVNRSLEQIVCVGFNSAELFGPTQPSVVDVPDTTC